MTQHKAPRDRTRQPQAKHRTLTRRAARTGKSALQFLCIAFPADLSALQA